MRKILKRILKARKKLAEYEQDKKDRWQYPAETMSRGAGDCEDLAILALAMVRMAGMDGWTERCQSRTTLEGHMVCVVGEQWVIDVNSVYPYDELGDRYITYGGNKNTQYTWPEIIAYIEERLVE